MRGVIESMRRAAAPVAPSIKLSRGLLPMNSSAESILAEKPAPKKRIWEIDFVRGFLIFFVIFDHLMWDISDLGQYFHTSFGKAIYTFSLEYYNALRYETVLGNLRELTRYSFVMLFVFVSGVSSQLSKNNLSRGLKLLSFSLVFSVVVEIAGRIESSIAPIWFNVIHVIAICILVYAGLSFIHSRCKLKYQKNLFMIFTAAIVIFTIISGYYFLEHPYDGAVIGGFFFTPVRWIEDTISPGDHLTLFPALGFFLLGAFLGKKLYPEGKTLFESVNDKYLKPVTFVGRHSLLFYFASQVVMFGSLYLIGVKAGLL